MRRAPFSARYAPVARPRSATKSSGKSASPLPRMSYWRNTLGFIPTPSSQQIVAARLLRGLDDAPHILRTFLRYDQYGVFRSDDDQIAHAQHAHVGCALVRHH